MTQDKISIIVPVWEAGQLLDRCLRSIMRQTFQEFEILLVDDGSKGCCPQMCDAWKQRCEKVRVIHKAHGGLSDARNAGLQEAAGEYITFVESSDWMEPDYLQRLLSACTGLGCEVAVCKRRRIWKDGERKLSNDSGSTQIVRTQHAVQKLISGEISQTTCGKLYAERCIDGRLFESGYQEEYWNCRVIGAAKKIALLDYAGYNEMQRETGKYSLRCLDIVRAKERRQQYLQEYYPQLEAEGERNLLLTCLCHGQKVLEQLSGTEREQAMFFLEQTVQRHIPEDSLEIIRNHGWLCLAVQHFEGVCWIRNVLRMKT